MKRFTYAQILKAFAKATPDSGRFNDILDGIANAPFYKTIVNIQISFTARNNRYCRWFHMPIHILVKGVDIKRSILKEIATQTHRHRDLTYIKPAESGLEFNAIAIKFIKPYSFDGNAKYAIFHEEQECGCSWLVINANALSAPFTYDRDYNTKAIRRSETDQVIVKNR